MEHIEHFSHQNIVATKDKCSSFSGRTLWVKFIISTGNCTKEAWHKHSLCRLELSRYPGTKYLTFGKTSPQSRGQILILQISKVTPTTRFADGASNHEGKQFCCSVIRAPLIPSTAHAANISCPSPALAVVQVHVQARQNKTHLLLAPAICQQMFELRFSRCIWTFGYVIPHAPNPSLPKASL